MSIPSNLSYDDFEEHMKDEGKSLQARIEYLNYYFGPVQIQFAKRLNSASKENQVSLLYDVYCIKNNMTNSNPPSLPKPPGKEVRVRELHPLEKCQDCRMYGSACQCWKLG